MKLERNGMHKMKKFGLIMIGLVAGVMLSLNLSAVAQKETASSPLPVQELRTFADIFGRIKSDYVDPKSDKELINSAINGMVTGLDPHSAYYDADAYKELQIGTEGEFGGLGIEVTMEDGLVKVVSPIEDTPAYKAGIKSGDLILKLDDTLVKGMTLNDAVKKMRGKPDTPIVLTVLRKGESKPLVFKLVRAIIKVKSVKYKMAEPGYAYIRITQFQEHTGESLAAALHELFKSPVKGLVLDLRNDPGGLLFGAVAVSAAFLPPDAPVVSTRGRTPDSDMKLETIPEDYLKPSDKTDYIKDLPPEVKTVPMIVLVNNGTASASEIVSGALQDDKRALIMGTQTFGKGSVQTIFPLGNGTAVKLTTARYYTPSGKSIQAKGITPDITVQDTTVSSQEASLNLHEADLEHHLINEKAGSGAKPKVTIQETEQNAKPAEPGSKDDYMLNQALNMLKGMAILQKK